MDLGFPAVCGAKPSCLSGIEMSQHGLNHMLYIICLYLEPRKLRSSQEILIECAGSFSMIHWSVLEWANAVQNESKPSKSQGIAPFGCSHRSWWSPCASVWNSGPTTIFSPEPAWRTCRFTPYHLPPGNQIWQEHPLTMEVLVRKSSMKSWYSIARFHKSTNQWSYPAVFRG